MRFALLLAMAMGLGPGAASAQSPDRFGNDSGASPSLILPDQLTNPITGDFTPREEGFAAGGDPGTSAYQSEGEVWVQPYQVEGEETLEPNSN